MEPLGALCGAEETVVRERAVESTSAVVSVLSAEQVMETVVPVLQKLSGGDWFTSRISACGLFKVTYERLVDPDTRRILRSLFVTLSTDDTPMVRRAAAKAVGPLATVVEHDFVVSELVLVFHALASEEPDSVRLLAVEGCTAFAKVLTPAESAAHVLPLVSACARDKSWRVRNNVAREFTGLAEAVTDPNSRTELLNLFVNLLRDPEAEVRASAAKCVAKFSKLVGSEAFLSAILPAMDVLSGPDSPAQVKTAIAEAVMELPSIMALQPDIAARSIVPLIDRLLVDDTSDVKLKVLEGIPLIASSGAVSKRYIQESILPTLEKLGQDPLWRVRERVIEQLPLLVHTLVSIAAAAMESCV
jgi:serine/threonine-protein phosphatase 2A regulatory subunit A